MAEQKVDRQNKQAPESKTGAAEPYSLRGILNKLGPGLVTGASDDDPSGIGTYSQAGAQLGVTTE